MIPDDRDDLEVLAGEYVLGVLDPAAAREIEAALAGNAVLRRAVERWQARLDPLSRLALPVEPPVGLWQRIENSIGAKPPPPGLCASLVLWRWSTVAATAIAACLALYIAFAPPAAAPRYVAVLHAPQQLQPAFVATGGRERLFIHAVAQETPPGDRGFELWAIPAGAKPVSLGLMPETGRLELAMLPVAIGEGVTLAITIEPKTGAPHASPSGAPVFLGTLVAAR
jgi:anti-sigma-K factor RskA